MGSKGSPKEAIYLQSKGDKVPPSRRMRCVRIQLFSFESAWERQDFGYSFISALRSLNSFCQCSSRPASQEKGRAFRRRMESAENSPFSKRACCLWHQRPSLFPEGNSSDTPCQRRSFLEKFLDADTGASIQSLPFSSLCFNLKSKGSANGDAGFKSVGFF